MDVFKESKISGMLRSYEQQVAGSRYHWWDTEQQKMIELPFEDYEPMAQYGLWWVFDEGKSYLYDAATQQVISAAYDFIGDVHNGLIIVENDGKFGVINDKGKEVYPLEYDMALQNESGFIALSWENKNQFWDTLYLRPDGEPIISAPMRTWSSPDHYEAPLIRDRKSTRLNSSHVAISYAV